MIINGDLLIKKTFFILILIFISFQSAQGAVTEIYASDFSSSASIIKFDDLAVSTHVGAQFSSKGVTFLDDKLRTPLIVNSNNRGSIATRSEPNSLFNDADYPQTNAKLPLEMTFEKPVRKVGMYIGNGKQSQLTAVLYAFDKAGKSLGAVKKSVSDPVTGFIGLKADSDIYRVTLEYGDSTLGEQIDDLMFEGEGIQITAIKTPLIAATVTPIVTISPVITITPINTALIVDRIKPTVNASHSPPNPSTSQMITFTATASDVGGIHRLLIWVDGDYVKECPGSPCTYTGGPYAGPRVEYYGYAIDNYDNYAATDYKYVHIGPIDTTLPEVYALQSPLHPMNSQMVTFTAKATDNHPSGIDHIWLYVDGSYVKRCDSDTCSYTGGPYSKNKIQYFALAYDKSGNRGTSGYIDFTVGPYSGNTVPILHTGDSRTKIDVVFIPSTEYDGNMAQFYSDITNSIKNGYYASDPIFKNRNKFNFYYFKNTVNVGTKTITGVSGTLCDWSAPSGWSSVTFADSGAIIHRFDCRDSAGGGLFSSEWNSYRTLVHESGHSIFGIADEYCCDSFYFEPSPNPNIWDSRTKCRNAASANGWDPNDCVQLTSGTSSINWWKSDPEPDIMKSGGGTVWDFNRADMKNVNWLFSECAAWRC